jgi:pimeloyl-ACP methyl ester carboxylesterase
MTLEVVDRWVRVNGVRLHYVEAGTGPLVVLLHGFPEFWYAWRRQIPALVAAGYRVIAPDLRGYNLSSKPGGVACYTIDKLTRDVAELIRSFRQGPAALVAGHDWGGVVAWSLPLLHPACLARLATLNAPHPARFQSELRRPDQLRRSWYMFFFQIPWLPEFLMRWRGRQALTRLLRYDPARPDAFTDEDIDRYLEAFDQPGVHTAAVNYYRAAIRSLFQRPPVQVGRIDTPTLVIWGERDRFLNPHLCEGLDPWVRTLRIERLPEASHWVMADAPERVNALLVDFLREQHGNDARSVPVAR